MNTQTEEGRQTMKNSVGRGVVVAVSVLLQAAWLVWLFIRLNQYYGVISLITSLLSLLVVLHICGDKINNAYKLSWIVLLLLFPITGLCLFLLFGQESSTFVMKRKFGRIGQELQGCLPQDPEAAARLEALDAGLANQFHYLQRTAGYPVYDDT